MASPVLRIQFLLGKLINILSICLKNSLNRYYLKDSQKKKTNLNELQELYFGEMKLEAWNYSQCII